MKNLLLVLAGFIATGTFYAASAQDGAEDGPTPEQMAAAATTDRQAVFKLLRFNIGPIIAMTRGAPFDAELAERNGRRIAAIAPMISETLAAMDTRGYGVETEALDSIWDNMDDFQVKTQALVDAANDFADAASGGDMAATLGAVRGLGGTCGNCHETYREDND